MAYPLKTESINKNDAPITAYNGIYNPACANTEDVRDQSS